VAPFPANVEATKLRFPVLKTAPPKPKEAMLFVKVEPVMDIVPEFAMPAPFPAVLFRMSEKETIMEPEL
jgi:hypothetical protein